MCDKTNHKDKVLIVDEDKNVKDKMRVMLEEDGFEVFECNDCIEAYELLKNKMMDLVLVNIEKACDEGIDAIEKIKADYPNLPLVVTSHTV
jgi:DNA-binding NtrC family response regulator